MTTTLWQVQRIQPLRAFDQPFYLGIAYDLVHHGRYTDGFMFTPEATRPPGMRFAPLYPMLVAAAARVDGGLRRGMDCVVETQDACPAAVPSLRALQFLELALVLWLVWWMGGVVGGPGVGALGLLLAFGAVPLLLRSVDYLMTEMTNLALVVSAIACAMQAARRPTRRLAWAAAAGVLLGLAALTRPAFFYLVPAALPGIAAIGRRRALVPLAGFAVAAGLVLAPWVLRNAVELGRPALTYGYDSHTLVQRIAFDTMDWPEYGRAYLCWLPDGTGIGRALIGPHACDRFGWDEQPTSFYVLGQRKMLPETLQAAGGYAHHLGYLLTHCVRRMPVWHALVSIPLALRGAYVAHWWGFVLLWPALAWSWAARPGGPGAKEHDDAVWRPGFLLLALPAWFMLALNAAVAVNQVRYNLLLVPSYAVAGALTLFGLARKTRLLRAAGRAA